MEEIQHIRDRDGKVTAVLVPIDLWREISSELETAYLLRSETMKRRLLEASERREGLSREQVRDKLGI